MQRDGVVPNGIPRRWRGGTSLAKYLFERGKFGGCFGVLRMETKGLEGYSLRSIFW